MPPPIYFREFLFAALLKAVDAILDGWTYLEFPRISIRGFIEGRLPRRIYSSAGQISANFYSRLY